CSSDLQAAGALAVAALDLDDGGERQGVPLDLHVVLGGLDPHLAGQLLARPAHRGRQHRVDRWAAHPERPQHPFEYHVAPSTSVGFPPNAITAVVVRGGAAAKCAADDSMP